MKKQIRFYEKMLKYETDACNPYAALSDQARVIAVDARFAEAFAGEHIPAEINIPHRVQLSGQARMIC
jgi:rhodanese-related sulfurtransferase